MNKPKFPPEWPSNAVECGAGLVVGGKRYLVVEMKSWQMNQDCLKLEVQLIPYEKVDPILYYATPKPAKRAPKRKTKK